MSYSDSQAAIVLDTAVPGVVVAGGMVYRAFQHAEVAKVLHVRTASRDVADSDKNSDNEL